MSSENMIRRRIAGLRRYLNYDWEDLGAGHIRATVPSFPYEALDVSGDKISPLSLLKLFDSVSSGYFSTSDADWPTTGADGAVFIPMLYALNVALDVERAFYDVRGRKFPLVVDTRLKYVKRASSCFEKTVSHATSGTLFAKISGIDVNVDYVTRKPTPYPEWFRRKIISDVDEKRVEYTIPTKPQVGVFKSQHIIRFSDTDENRHTNYSTYSRVCIDSLCENMIAGNYGSGWDAYNLALRRMEVTFKKESKLGDVITVKSWQDALNGDTFYFEISNINGDVITTSMMRFYESKYNEQSKM